MQWPDVRRRRVLAIASGGGHWVQLQRLRPAFEGCDVAYVSVFPDYAEELGGAITEKLAELFSETHGAAPAATAPRRRLHS